MAPFSLIVWFVSRIRSIKSKIRSGRIDQSKQLDQKWLIKINEVKSVHADFTNKRCQHIPITINDQAIPHSNTAKYLGITLDAKLRWKAHVKKER
jgi:hypothetical protein